MKDRLIGFAIVALVVAAYALFIDPAVDRHDRRLEEQQRQKQEQLSVSTRLSGGRNRSSGVVRARTRSERTVYVPVGLTEILAGHITATGATDWLFAGEVDQPPHQNTIGYRWREAQKAAGVAGRKLHDLRHFFASGLIAAG